MIYKGGKCKRQRVESIVAWCAAAAAAATVAAGSQRWVWQGSKWGARATGDDGARAEAA